MIWMQWVEGRTLDRYLVQGPDREAIGVLAESWRDPVRRMQTARFAHGDLQHGNVLVDGDGTPRLVDFDCSWIPHSAAVWVLWAANMRVELRKRCSAW
jgi:Ser/Thr protein kinase RdoA (MazF antagonist)